MTILIPAAPTTLPCELPTDDMIMFQFARETSRNYVRDVNHSAEVLGRSPATATAENVRRLQVEQQDVGLPLSKRLALLVHLTS